MRALLTEGKLKEHPFLNQASIEFLERLEEFATEISFQKGEVILKEGDYADRFYLILTGKVALEASANGSPHYLIQTIGPGEVLGWSWLYPPFEWHFTAKALEPTTAIQFNAAALLVRAEEDPKFGYELMKRIGRQVVQRLQSTRKRLIHKIRQQAGRHELDSDRP